MQTGEVPGVKTPGGAPCWAEGLGILGTVAVPPELLRYVSLFKGVTRPLAIIMEVYLTV